MRKSCLSGLFYVNTLFHGVQNTEVHLNTLQEPGVWLEMDYWMEFF